LGIPPYQTKINITFTIIIVNKILDENSRPEFTFLLSHF